MQNLKKKRKIRRNEIEGEKIIRGQEGEENKSRRGKWTTNLAKSSVKN